MVRSMDHDLVRTGAFGVLGALLVVELVAAARSWFDARRGSRRGRAAHWSRPPEHGALLLSQAFAIRDHLARRRPMIHALRRQFPALGTEGYGRDLRTSIGRLRPRSLGMIARGCPSCRGSRLRGEGHCLDCRRRLIMPAMSRSV